MSKLNIIPETVPVILGGAGTKPNILSAFHTGEATIKFPNIHLTEDLNHSEITLLRTMLNEYVLAHEQAQGELKEYIQSLWLKCNPEDTSIESEDSFAELNHTKDAVRKLKKQKKTIQNILFKLKKQQKNCN